MFMHQQIDLKKRRGTQINCQIYLFSDKKNLGYYVHRGEATTPDQDHISNRDLFGTAQTPDIPPGQIVYACQDGSKHDARDPMTGVDGKKAQVQTIFQSSHSSENSQSKFAKDDAWWRGTRTNSDTSPVSTTPPIRWNPTHRPN